MNRVILGGEAVRAGVATRHELRRDYTTLYRGVFVRNGVEVTLRDRAVGAWLATGRQGTPESRLRRCTVPHGSTSMLRST